MLDICVKSHSKEKADKCNYNICDFFSGTDAFKNNDIIVTPVEQNHDEFFRFYICFDIDNLDKQTIIFLD